jgi:hypothetical protein
LHELTNDGVGGDVEPSVLLRDSLLPH